MKRFLVLLTLAVVILTGCATSEIFKGKNVEINNDTKKVVIYLDQPPVMTTGIPRVNYRDGQEFAIPLHYYLAKTEYRIFRISWVALGVDSDGNIYPGIVVIDKKRKNSKGQLWLVGKILCPKRNGISVVIASTRGKVGFSSEEAFILFPEKFVNLDYRKGLYLKGDLLDNLPDPERFDRIISNWKYKRTTFGDIRTPLNKEMVKYFSLKYTGYTENDRAQRDGKNLFALAPIAMGISWLLDVKSKYWGPTTGWDMDSEMSDEEKELVAAEFDEAVARAEIAEYKGGIR